LLSWLLRLATRLGVSFHTLATECFGVDDRLGHTHWWRRPRPGVLKRIASRTGIGLTRLHQMTLHGWQPSYRDDEVSARFTGQHFDSNAAMWRRYCWAVCGSCLEGDTTPYLRNAWLMGWLAVCPHHTAILLERCHACGLHLRAASLATTTSFSPAICKRCGTNLLGGPRRSADPAVTRIQTALLYAKQQGITELGGLGQLSWKQVVSLADVLIGMIWTELTQADREDILLIYALDQETPLEGIHDSRHESLKLLAWLVEGWPKSAGARVAQSILVRWSMLTLNQLDLLPPALYSSQWIAGPNQFEPSIRHWLQTLANAAD
jgi:TniQ